MVSYLCRPVKSSFNNRVLRTNIAEVAHLVEHDLAKVGVAGSSPVFRSNIGEIFSRARSLSRAKAREARSSDPELA